MLEWIGKLGVPGALGLLLGLGAVAWIGPTTDGGALLVVVACVASVMILAGLVALFRGKPASQRKDDQTSTD